MKVLILNYTGYRENWGSQATSRGLVEFLIRSVFVGKSVDIDILPYPPSHIIDHWQEWRHGAVLTNIYGRECINQEALHVLERLTRVRFGDILDRISQADIIFFQGEGAILGQRDLRRTQIYGPLLLAKLLYLKPVISLNQTIAFRSEQTGRQLRAIFGKLDMTILREPESFGQLQRAGWRGLGLIADAAFFYRPELAMPEYLTATPYFCVTGSADLKSYNLQTYMRSVMQLAQTSGLQPVFLYSRKSDAAMVKAFRELGGLQSEVVTIATHPDIDQILPILRDAEFVLGGRYHSSISALTQGTPVILTASNSHKSLGLSQMFGPRVAPYIADPTPETLVRAAQGILREASVIRELVLHRYKTVLDEMTQAAEPLRHFTTQLPASDTLHIQYPDPRLDGAMRRPVWLRPISRLRNLACFDRPHPPHRHGKTGGSV